MEEKDYKQLMWDINSNGDYSTFSTTFDSTLELKNHHASYNHVTSEFLYLQYKKYTEKWNIEFGTRDKKFIRADDKYMDCLKFINSCKYNETFTVQATNPARDAYIFGNHSKASLHAQLHDFKSKINKDYVGKFKQEPIKTTTADNDFF